MTREEKNSDLRKYAASAPLASSHEPVEVSGGANLHAENIDIGGDVVGRDKVVAAEGAVVVRRRGLTLTFQPKLALTSASSTSGWISTKTISWVRGEKL